MPKKQQRNSFYFYMIDYKQEQEKLGRRFNGGLRDVQEEAGELWKELPPTIRAKYEKKAKDYKNNGPCPKKYTSTGIPIDVALMRKLKIEEEEQQNRQAVANLICDRKTATEKMLFVIDVNYYCETKELFVINEMSVVAFNVQKGLESVYHTIVDPVCIPRGYASSAKDSKEEHGFGLPPLSDGVSDKTLILSQMLEFLDLFGADEHGIIPLFTLDDKCQPVQSFLDQVCGDHSESDRFVLYKLSSLLCTMSKKLCRDPSLAMPQETVALMALKEDKFQYCSDLACDFHEETDLYYNCTKSRVKRWVFTILDYCCPLADVKLVRGDHGPEAVDPGEASQIIQERQEQREEMLRAQRQRESSVKFSFVEHGVPNQWPLATPAPVVAAADNMWPSLGAAAPRKVQATAEPKGAWGIPAGAVTPTPKRTPLRRPGCEPEGKLAQLSASGCDSLGITRGRGRGSVTSIHND